MESRKYQLQKQIIEALKANDKELYSLLKSQWAHRFGVETLEELNKIDLSQGNDNPTNEDNQKIEKPQNDSFENDEVNSLKDDDMQEKEITNDSEIIDKSVEVENKESFKINSYEIVDKENHEKKATNTVIKYNNQPKVKALIPIPPKPKYSYLNRWLLRR